MRIHLHEADYYRITITATTAERKKAAKVVNFLEEMYDYSFSEIPQYLGGIEYRCFANSRSDFV